MRTVAASDAVYKHDNVTRTPCPVCGKYMLEVKGKKGKMLVCQDRTCGYRESLSVVTGARCPECHKTMELRGKDDKRIFVCSCGFKQKYDVFTAKRKENASAAPTSTTFRTFCRIRTSPNPRATAPLPKRSKRRLPRAEIPERVQKERVKNNGAYGKMAVVGH